MDVSERIYALLAPVVETIEVELLDVEFKGGTLRVIVDDLPAEDRAASEDGSVEDGSEHDSQTEDNSVDALPDGDEAVGDVADSTTPPESPAYKGITMDRVAAVNRLVSPILDQHDPIPGRYTLEVSSPGLERPLRRPAHYRQAIGEDVVVKMERHLTPRRLRGRLNACTTGDGTTGETASDTVDGDTVGSDTVGGDTVGSDTVGSDTVGDDTVGGERAIMISLEVVEIDGVELSEAEEREIALVDVDSARTVFVWGPSPKPGQPGAKKPGQPGSKKSGGKSNKKKQNKKSSSQPRGSR